MDLIASLDARYLDKIDRALAQATIVLIGNFDGFHLGHQRLLAQCLELRNIKKGKVCVLTFDPNPSQYFGRMTYKDQLFTPTQKIRAFAEAGADCYLSQSFDKEFSLLSAEDFYCFWLKAAVDAKVIVVGYDFHFGYKRQGSAQWLYERGKKDGVEVFIAEPENFEANPISSSRIRHLLDLPGRFHEARRMLGRPYFFEGHLTKHYRLLDIKQKLPCQGFYAIEICPLNSPILEKAPDAQVGVLAVSEESALKVFSSINQDWLDQNVGIQVHAFLGSKDESWPLESVMKAIHWKNHE